MVEAGKPGLSTRLLARVALAEEPRRRMARGPIERPFGEYLGDRLGRSRLGGQVRGQELRADVIGRRSPAGHGDCYGRRHPGGAVAGMSGGHAGGGGRCPKKILLGTRQYGNVSNFDHRRMS